MHARGIAARTAALPHTRTLHARFESVSIVAFWLNAFSPWVALLVIGVIFAKMQSNSFAWSADDIAWFEAMHARREFLASDEVECFVVEPADDTSEDRVIYGFGQQCPLELVDGANVCKTFKEKRYGCKSCVSEAISRNYLAKHAFDSSNHPSCGQRDLAFDAADMVESVQELETMRQRNEYRIQVRGSPWTATWEWTDDRERSPRGTGKGEKGKGKVKGKSDAGKGNKGKPEKSKGKASKNPPYSEQWQGEESGAWSSSSQEPSGSTAVDVPPIKPMVRVAIEELQALADCLQRAADTQKRTIDSLQHYARQMEDERKVFVEARDVIGRMMITAQLQITG